MRLVPPPLPCSFACLAVQLAVGIGWRCRAGLPESCGPRGTQAASGRPACSLRNLPRSFPRAKADRMEELPVGSLGTPGARAVPRALTDAVRPGAAVRLSPGGRCWVLARARVSAGPACTGVGLEGSRPAPSLLGLPPRARPLLEPTPQASGMAPRSTALLDGCVRRRSWPRTLTGCRMVSSLSVAGLTARQVDCSVGFVRS